MAHGQQRPDPTVVDAPPVRARLLTAEITELDALRSRFCVLIADWRLTQGELRDLLGIDGGWREDRVVPDVVGPHAETAMRLLLRLDAGLGRFVDPPMAVADWLRAPDPRFSGIAPLTALADLPTLRAAVRAVEEPMDPVW